MKAAVQHEYGSSDVLHVEDVDPPMIRDDEVLLRVMAASVHPGNVMLMRGVPYVMRLGLGLSRPRNPIPGFDVAGVVLAVGSRVVGIAVGDHVFGEGRSTLAELATAAPSRLAAKPPSLSFEEAAVIPVSGTAALRAMRDVAEVEPGQTVLVNGASGGVGVFAVQIARAFGADVTGVCGPDSVDLVRSLGADDVIDYTVTDVANVARRFDVILDNVGNVSLADWRRVLSDRGTLIPNNGTAGGRWLGALPRIAHAALTSLVSTQRLRTFVATITTADLEELADLVVSGAVRPVVGATYGLDEAPDAVRLVAGGHARGKVAISIATDEDTRGLEVGRMGRDR